MRGQGVALVRRLLQGFLVVGVLGGLACPGRDPSYHRDAGGDQADATDDSAVGDLFLGDSRDEDQGASACEVAPFAAKCSCSNNEECASSACMTTSVGSACAQKCTGNQDCQSSQVCAPVGPGSLLACIEKHPNQCRPCAGSQDCLQNNAAYPERCVPFDGAGQYCLASCDIDGACPDGFACSGEGEGLGPRNCLPTGGKCFCTLEAAATGISDLAGCTLFFRDVDRDQFGVTLDSKCLCGAKGEFSATRGDDCDDGDAEIHPGAAEVCNGKDDDCNGLTDEELGNTNCGKAVCAHEIPNCLNGTTQTCDPLEGATVETCNRQDDDCDGETDEGFASTNCGLGVCEHTVPECLDGVPQACEPLPVTTTETCNGLDDDCDGATDEEGAGGCTTFFLDADQDTYGLATDSKCLCGPSGEYVATRAGDCLDSDESVHEGAPEVCNGKDDNCDGRTDEGDFLCAPYKCVAGACTTSCDTKPDCSPGAWCTESRKCDGDHVLSQNLVVADALHPPALAMAVSSDGAMVSAWQNQIQTGDPWSIRARLLGTDFGVLGDEVRIDDATSGNQVTPDVVATAKGWFVAWKSESTDGTTGRVRARWIDLSGAMPASSFNVDTDTTYMHAAPSVAAWGDGRIVAVWQSKYQDGSGSGVYGQLFDASGTKSGTEFLVNSRTDGDQDGPRVAALENGNFVVVWQDYDSQQKAYDIASRRFKFVDAEPIGSDVIVNSTRAGRQGQPVVASLKGGGYVVAWNSEGQDQSFGGIFFQRFDGTGTPISVETSANQITQGDQSLPSLTPLADGRFLIAWQSANGDGDGLGIVGRRFDVDGAPVAADFVINEDRTGDQKSPRVALLPDGRFDGAWWSTGRIILGARP